MIELKERPKKSEYRTAALDFDNADPAAFSEVRIQKLHESGAISLQESFALQERFGELKLGVNLFAWVCLTLSFMAVASLVTLSVGSHKFSLFAPETGTLIATFLAPASIIAFFFAMRRSRMCFDKLEFGLAIAGLSLSIFITLSLIWIYGAKYLI